VSAEKSLPAGAPHEFIITKSAPPPPDFSAPSRAAAAETAEPQGRDPAAPGCLAPRGRA